MPSSTVISEVVGTFESKPHELAHFIGYDSPSDPLAPGVLSVVCGWNCPTADLAIEVCVASAIIFRLLGYNSILLVCDEENRRDLGKTVKRRTSWSSDLAMDDCVVDVDTVIAQRMTADAILYMGGSAKRTVVASQANLVFWFCHGDGEPTSPCFLALNESVSMGLSAERTPFPIPDPAHLLALAYSMQMDKYRSG
jgi:hypothetical protein